MYLYVRVILKENVCKNTKMMLRKSKKKYNTLYTFRFTFRRTYPSMDMDNLQNIRSKM